MITLESFLVIEQKTNTSQMRFLLSSLFFVLLGCTSYPKKMGYKVSGNSTKNIVNPYFSDTKKDYVYKAKIQVFDNAFGGILVIKKIAETEHRIVFTTELGNTIFDFSLQDDEFKVNRILKEMDKKILIAILKKDFRALVKENIDPIKVYQLQNKTISQTNIDINPHFYTFENDSLLRIVRVGNQKEKVVFLFSKISDNIVEHIQISHQNMKLKIELNAF